MRSGCTTVRHAVVFICEVWMPVKNDSVHVSNILVFCIQVIYSLYLKIEQLLCYIDFIGSIEQTLFLHETSCKTHYFGNKKNVF